MYYQAYSVRRPGCGIVWMHVGAMRPEAPGCKLVLIRVLMLRITRAPHHAVFPVVSHVASKALWFRSKLSFAYASELNEMHAHLT
jgi:hypothetical protein